MRGCCLPLIASGLVALGLAVSGCAASDPAGTGPSAAADRGVNDPLEEANRGIFSFNQAVDNAVLIPAAKAYRTVLPPPVRQSVHDFLQNLDEPVVFANDVLQGQGQLAVQTLGRVLINTTAGVGGFFDVATRLGIPYHSNDLGITFARWGIAAGPYIMIPVLGPSNPRDIAGQIGDSFADPGDYVAAQHNVWIAVLSRHVTAGVDERSRNIETLAQIQKTALDYYATIRSLYRQRRAAQIRHEQPNLPNPSPVQGGDAGPEPAISYSIAKPPQTQEVPAR
jgi:phospholipid-binding lipoprotein MlaA